MSKRSPRECSRLLWGRLAGLGQVTMAALLAGRCPRYWVRDRPARAPGQVRSRRLDQGAPAPAPPHSTHCATTMPDARQYSEPISITSRKRVGRLLRPPEIRCENNVDRVFVHYGVDHSREQTR